MAREPFQSKVQRASKIITILKRTYPDAHCELNYKNPLELLVATILSAQTTDKRVNQVTDQLFRKYRSAQDYMNADGRVLEQELKPLGFFRAKAKHLQACCRSLFEKHHGEVPQRMEDLIQLGGVGRKTANVVLGNAFGINVGVVVDTHVQRLSRRLGFTKHTTPEKIEADLQRLVPQAEWTFFSHLLIWHGRRRCFARNPDCPSCEVRDLCPVGRTVTPQ